MAYCTKAQLIDRFGETELRQRTDRAGTGAINDAVLAQAIADADAEINGYLTAYPLPLAIVPANFARIACDITRYYLYDDAVIAAVKDRYDSAIKYLAQIAGGKISIAPDTSGAVVATARAEVEFQSSAPVFVRGGY